VVPTAFLVGEEASCVWRSPLVVTLVAPSAPSLPSAPFFPAGQTVDPLGTFVPAPTLSEYPRFLTISVVASGTDWTSNQRAFSM